MKAITILTAIVIIITSCNCQKKTVETPIVENNIVQNKVQSKMDSILYVASTRGSFFKIKIENKTIYFTKNRDIKEYEFSEKISDVNWQKLNNLFEKVNLNDVKNYKGITEHRHYDGALHADVTFVSDGVGYTTDSFDHGDAPKEIKELVELILELAPKK